jgi:membrane protein implicated in regulation of membrane protease activity
MLSARFAGIVLLGAAADGVEAGVAAGVLLLLGAAAVELLAGVVVAAFDEALEAAGVVVVAVVLLVLLVIKPAAGFAWTFKPPLNASNERNRDAATPSTFFFASE